MIDSFRARNIVVLFAAYVIALQALLLPLSVAAGPTIGPALCLSGTSTGRDHPPAGDQQQCPCAAGCGVQCCTQALITPPQIVIALLIVPAVAIVTPHFSDFIQRSSDFEPHAPRGPPLA